MTSAVDTNVLLDVLVPNPAFLARSKALLERSSIEGALCISELVQAELAAHFPQSGELRDFLASNRLHLVDSQDEALFLAGRRWRAHRQAAGPPQCPACATILAGQCPNCAAPIGFRQHLLADFLVGAHAVHHAHRLLSRDRGFYGRYFPELTVLDA